ncbi:pentatricopeptide repeat-containing protein At5g27110 [Mercurialis annua]|uniref:pentatricopeptide repeat-containing protein At5g27110 n=1 Tax=Mercurialis annua TaxID=3986 RepID=UPI00215FB207|nr:pentatricopeptide repeat-containing protein At5g27110 [Mercurialis annua]XP_050203572.1 pentatricopeptide repeat-containing protein At5g27110 [Mercurialis annua]
MDTAKLSTILLKCITSNSLLRGKLCHQKIITLGLQNNVALCKNLIKFYFSFQTYDYAKLVFKTIDNPLDISLWNGLMAAYTKNYMYIEALELFQSLLQFPHLKPDSFTYPSLLKACAGLGKVSYGRMVHAHVVKSGFVSDTVVVSSLVRLYGKCDLFVCAVKLFDEMPERDVVSWNTVISCCYQDGRAGEALELFGRMREFGFEPNSVTVTVAISCCARVLDLERGREIHRDVVDNGLVFDGFVSSALVDMYGKCGCLDVAKDIFERMTKKTPVAWNSLIAGYSLVGDSKECIQLLKRMIMEGTQPTLTTLTSILLVCSRVSHFRHGRSIHGYLIRHKVDFDIFVGSGLIDLYFKCGRIPSAENIFNMLLPDANAVSWNIMISGYVSVGDYFKTIGLFDEMKGAKIKPDAVTFSTVLSACSQLAALVKGKEIHNCVEEQGLETNEIVMGALLDMYAKCGAVDEALNVFNKLPEKDLISWTSMITAYGSHGQAFEALKLFEDMQQSDVKPDAVTFIAVLSACGHAGLVDEGYGYFNQMTTDYGIKPGIEHCSCLIDLLGRAGRLHEAYNILQNSPEIIDDVGLLSTLLSACLLHKDVELGEEIAELLIRKDPDDSATYITLSNLYASVKNWEKMGMLRLKMKELGLKKNPGCSWIEIDKRIQPFFVKDWSHPEPDMVHDCLVILYNHMEKDELPLP